jgi:hypothetical protein
LTETKKLKLMKTFITLLLFVAATVTIQAQTTLTCGKHNISGVGEKLSSVKYIGSDKKSNDVTNYYYLFTKEELIIWREELENGESKSIEKTTITKKDISTKNAPYLDLFPASEYEKPIERIYINCGKEECMQTESIYSWTNAGDVLKSTNGFYQIDGADKKIQQVFLDKLLAWIKN